MTARQLWVTVGQPCGGCSAPMAPSRSGRGRHVPPVGEMKEHGGRGLCVACYRAETVVRGTGVWGSYKEPSDWAVIERVLAGERMPTNVAERRAVVAARPRSSVRSLARLLGVAERTIQRYRAADRLGVTARTVSRDRAKGTAA